MQKMIFHGHDELEHGEQRSIIKTSNINFGVHIEQPNLNEILV